MKKLYVVRLTLEERERLHDVVHKGRVAAYKRRHAQVLLLVDQGAHGPAHPDRVAAERVEMAHRTVERIRQRCVLEGLEAALGRRKRRRERSRVLDGEAEAQLIAIACSESPEGCARWTLHLLADELKRRRIVASVSHETVRQVFEKTPSNLGGGGCGALRPSRTRPSCARWSRCWTCTRARMTRCIRWCAWTRRRSNA